MQGDYQFARIGEMLLIELQSLNCFEIVREKVEDFDIEVQPSQANGKWNEQ